MIKLPSALVVAARVIKLCRVTVLVESVSKKRQVCHMAMDFPFPLRDLPSAAHTLRVTPRAVMASRSNIVEWRFEAGGFLKVNRLPAHRNCVACTTMENSGYSSRRSTSSKSIACGRHKKPSFKAFMLITD